MDKGSDKKWSFLISLVLTIIIAAVYCQVCSFDFIDYDDPVYIKQNRDVQAGFTSETIKWAFVTDCAGNWHPLTWLSHMLDWRLFGSNPAGHHFTSLVFHIANTLLLFFVLRKMTGMLWPSAFVAALFALHPLHVESVAWVSERKDVLSTFFWMLTMWAYLNYTRRPQIGRYLIVAVFFALGLLSKPMLVTLPFVLMLIDYWPLGRLGSWDRHKRKKGGSGRSFVYLLVEKIPLFFMALVSCIITFIVQQKDRSLPSAEDCGLLIRLANASDSYLRYIAKMVWPVRLAVFYPHPGKNVSFLYAALSAAMLAAVTILILLFAKKRRYLVTGWLWYLGTLVPVAGLVQVGYQAMADRYSYIPLTGLFIIIAWGMDELSAKWRYRKIVLTMSVLLIISTVSVCTCFQLRYWQNDLILFQHALDVTENNNVARLHIAKFLYDGQRFDEAAGHYQIVIQIEPTNTEALQVLSRILVQQNRHDEAVGYLTEALRIKPDLEEIRVCLATVLLDSGNSARAVKEYEDFLRIRPDHAVAHNDFGIILFQLGQFDRAVTHLNRAIQIDPDYEIAKKNLNAILAAGQR